MLGRGSFFDVQTQGAEKGEENWQEREKVAGPIGTEADRDSMCLTLTPLTLRSQPVIVHHGC